MPAITIRNRSRSVVTEPHLRNDVWPTRSLVEQAPEALIPVKRRLRKRSSKVIAQLMASIREFGFIDPIIVDKDNVIVDGHGRWEAAKALDFPSVPTICVDHLTPEQVRAYRIAGNKLAELSTWDKGALGLEVGELEALEVNLDITGLSSVEIDELRIELSPETPDDDAPVALAKHPVSRNGDLWLLGQHRLYCGDALDAASYDLVMAGVKARLVFTDPPYNVAIDGFVSGLGKPQHREFVQGAGEMSEAEFEAFLGRYMRYAADASVDGAIHFHCMDWRHIKSLLVAGQAVYGEPKQLCVWVKTNAGMGSFYRSQHELITVFKVGSAPHVNTFGLGEGGRYRTNAWTYPGANSFGRDRDADLADHPTVKPTVMVMDAIRDCSRSGEVVLDPFGGSGTTLLAAERTRRRGRLIELDPLYVDVAIRRWQALTGKPATLEGDNRTFEATARSRGVEAAP